METLRQIWLDKQLRGKVLFTIAILAFIRVIAHLPLPAVDRGQMLNFLQQSENQVFGVLSLFTGGSISQLSIDLLGVGPYITASIVVQLMTKVIPAWEARSKEGSQGREQLNQYSRYLTIPLAVIQGYAMLVLLKSQGILSQSDWKTITEMLVAVTATSVFVMWLGEIISERGIGNGISLIISLGIVASLPQQIANTASVVGTSSTFNLIIFALIALATIVVIIAVNEAERRLPITYARRSVSTVTGQGVDSFLPIKVNAAGVIPIIFALSFLTIPAIFARFLQTAKSEWLVTLAEKITTYSSNNLFYGVAYFILVFVLTFFYTYIVFEPQQISDNLQKNSSFIPGVRPGNETTGYLRYIISRITLLGALFLAVIAILPLAAKAMTNITTLAIGGTSVLIVVSVVIDTSRQLASQLAMRRYDVL